MDFTDGLPLELRGKIKRIAVIEPPPAPVTFMDYTSRKVGRVFGLLGALATEPGARHGDSNRKIEWDKQTAGQTLDLRQDFLDALKADLQKQGYEVVMVQVPRKEGSGFLSASVLKKVGEKADFYLDTQMECGYWKQALVTKGADDKQSMWVPRMAVEIRGYTNVGSSPVFEQFCLNIADLNKDVSKEHKFETIEMLMQNSARATDGMRDAARRTAASVTRKLTWRTSLVYFFREKGNSYATQFNMWVHAPAQQSLLILPAKSVSYTTVDSGDVEFNLSFDHIKPETDGKLRLSVEPKKVYFYRLDLTGNELTPVAAVQLTESEGAALLKKIAPKLHAPTQVD